MSTPINLNRVRKARARVARNAKANENVVAFGRTKAEKGKDKAEAEKAARDLEGHKQKP